eukprot:SAG11_NODE_10935_length_795_cov_1.260057_1_plen_40_part_01
MYWGVSGTPFEDVLYPEPREKWYKQSGAMSCIITHLRNDF